MLVMLLQGGGGGGGFSKVLYHFEVTYDLKLQPKKVCKRDICCYKSFH